MLDDKMVDAGCLGKLVIGLRMRIKSSVEREVTVKAFCKMRCGKVAGMDETAVEFPKKVGDSVVDCLVKVISGSMTQGEVPED